jgi:hypothetical protein
MPEPFLWVILVFAGVVGGWVALWLLARRLRQAFPEVWNNLKRPPGYPVLSTAISEGWRAWKANLWLLIFVYRRDYIQLHDRKVAVFVWLARGCIALAYFAALFSFLA